MSDSNASTPTAAEIISDVSSLQIEALAFYAVVALLFYEYSITLSEEWKHVWKQQKSLVFWLFVGMRYGLLGAYIALGLSNVLPLVKVTDCHAITLLGDTLEAIADLSLHVMFALRVYAMWRRQWAITIVFILITAAKTVMDCFTFLNPSEVTTGFLRQFAVCQSDASPLYSSANEGNSGIIIAFDSLVLLLIALKTISSIVEMRRVGLSPGYAYFFLRDGILYYLAIELSVIAVAVLTPLEGGTSVFVISLRTVQPPLASIIAQRLVLNLRQVSYEECNIGEDDTAIGSLSFAHGTVIGNVGAPIRSSAEDERSTSVVAFEEEGCELPARTGCHSSENFLDSRYQ